MYGKSHVTTFIHSLSLFKNRERLCVPHVSWRRCLDLLLHIQLWIFFFFFQRPVVLLYKAKKSELMKLFIAEDVPPLLVQFISLCACMQVCVQAGFCKPGCVRWVRRRRGGQTSILNPLFKPALSVFLSYGLLLWSSHWHFKWKHFFFFA